jgi:hypothetical protein
MTFPSRREPQSREEFLVLLPAGLRAFVERELAAGNAVAETGTGFPAAPVGVWIRMEKYFQTAAGDLPEGVVFGERPHDPSPAECTDPRRHFFVLSGPEVVAKKARPKPAPPRLERVVPKQVLPRKEETPVFSAGSFGYADMVDRAALQGRVSGAIERHLGLMWDEKRREAVREEVGEEGLALVQEIDAFANRAEFWTRVSSTDRGYAEMQRLLRERYGFLSEGAVRRVATRAAWGWR